jgi:NTE family protein
MQVGAIQALLEHGIRPEILIGTSVGAINAAWMAIDPSPETARCLAEVWLQVTKDDVYPGTRLGVLWRLVTGQQSLYPNTRFYRFLQRHLPPGIETFADITGARLYIVATHLESGQMYLFGEDPSERVLDAIMASTALPPLHPPWCTARGCFVDGGAVSDLPLRVAVEKGAREIYALHLTTPNPPLPLRHTLSTIASQAVRALLHQQKTLDLHHVTHAQGVRLHHVELRPPGTLELPFWDFSHSAELIALGRQQMEEYLRQRSVPQPGRRQQVVAALERVSQRLRAPVATATREVGSLLSSVVTPGAKRRPLSE